MLDSTLLQGAAELVDLGVIRAEGADAASFLQGQLTNDVAALGAGQARLCGYCSPKGRLLASFIVWRDADDALLLACSADLLAATLKRMSMYVLRAKCRLSDASEALRLVGVAGRAACAAGATAWSRTDRAGATWVRLPDAAGVERALWVGERAVERPPLPALAVDSWRWLEVCSGVPRIVAATSDRFVPQMVNLELVGGVDFRKGCYPGQEVVARSQYRGTLKRRSLLFDTAGRPAPGDEIYHSADPGQPAGIVVDAAPSPDGGSTALLEIKVAALAHGSLHLGSPGGALLTRRPMPYGVPLDDAA